MYAFFMTLFVFLCIFLAIFVLIQQGKGDLGMGSISGNQMLFGGSGGQNFFERATWIMGAIFIFGALGLAILKTKEHRSSMLEGVQVTQKQEKPVMPQKRDDSHDASAEEKAENVAMDMSQESSN